MTPKSANTGAADVDGTRGRHSSWQIARQHLELLEVLGIDARVEDHVYQYDDQATESIAQE